jgi:hypothetical protein
MNTANGKDYQEIRRMILDFYHRGHELSDGELYRNILHDQWKIFWLNPEGKFGTADKETYISWYQPEKRDGNLEWTTEILNIDISGDLASAKVRIKNQQFGYLDFFNLMKLQGKWWMMHKISQRIQV